MKLKRIFACALTSIFTSVAIIASPVSATSSGKDTNEIQEIICSETNTELTRSNDKFEKTTSYYSDEETANETDDSGTENSEAEIETDETAYYDDETDEEMEAPTDRIQELKSKIKILKRENKALKNKSGILNLIKTCTRKLVAGTLAFVTSLVFLISTRPGIYILDSALDNFDGNGGAYHNPISHCYSGGIISMIPALAALLFV